MMRAPRIGLLGSYSSRNLGDTAIQLTVIRNLRARLPDAEIIGICTEPDDVRATLSIDAFPYTWELRQDGSIPFEHWPWRAREPLQRIAHLLRIYRFVRELDLLVISGGGQFDELWGGAFRQPYLLWIWTLMAKLRKVPIAAFGLGWDFIETRTAGRFCVGAMERADCRYVRDPGTAELLHRAGLRKPVNVGADPAFCIRPGSGGERGPTTVPRRFIVVSPIAASAIAPDSRAGHATHLEQLARACRAWMDEGFDIRFVCSQPVMDGPWITKLTDGLPCVEGGPTWRIAREPGVDAYLTEVEGATFVLSARLHGLILALATGSPVIGINYSRKIAQLLVDCGMQGFLVDPFAETAEGLLAKSRALMGSERQLREALRTYMHFATASLDSAYTSMLDLLPAQEQHRNTLK